MYASDIVDIKRYRYLLLKLPPMPVSISVSILYLRVRKDKAKSLLEAIIITGAFGFNAERADGSRCVDIFPLAIVPLSNGGHYSTKGLFANNIL